MEILTTEYDKQVASFKDDLSAVSGLLTVGELSRDNSLDAVSYAACTNVAIVILNLDEAITRN